MTRWNPNLATPNHRKESIMGLTIHYSLKAQGCDARARQLVTALHQAALDLPFKEVGAILDLSGDACDYKQRRQKNQLCWSLCEATCTVSLKSWQRLVADQPEETSFPVAPSRIIGFNAWPGEGCEEANFGLCQYPSTFAHPRLGRVKTRLAGPMESRNRAGRLCKKSAR